MVDNKFNFWLPAQIEKAKDKKTGQKVMKIKGIASTPEVDSEGETLLPVGFDLDRFLTMGFLNWNHQAKNDASKIIGEPVVAKVNNKGELYVEGVLYNGHPLAESVWSLGETLENNGSNRRLGFSIEGRALERDPMNPKKITKALLTGLAVTPTPVNASTYLDLVKGEQKEDFIEIETEELIHKSEGNYLYEFEVSGVSYGLTKGFEVEVIEKGLKFTPGTIREWNGKKYRKQFDNKWVEVIEGKTKEDYKRLLVSLTKDKLRLNKEQKNSVSASRQFDSTVDKIKEIKRLISKISSEPVEIQETEKSMDTQNTKDLVPESVSGKKFKLEPEIKKAIIAGVISPYIILEKSRKGVYMNTPENRKMGRVGQHYGARTESVKFKEDFIDEDTGEVVSLDRKVTQKIYPLAELIRDRKELGKLRNEVIAAQKAHEPFREKYYDAVYEVKRIEDDFKSTKNELRDLNIDMEEEVGRADESEKDKVGNEYGKKLNELQNKLKSLKEEYKSAVSAEEKAEKDWYNESHKVDTAQAKHDDAMNKFHSKFHKNDDYFDNRKK